MKKSFPKAVAVLVCFGFLLMAVPNLNFAEKKTPKLNITLLLSQSGQMLAALSPGLNPILNSGSKGKISRGTPSSGGIVRPTGDAPIGKPGTGD